MLLSITAPRLLIEKLAYLSGEASSEFLDLNLTSESMILASLTIPKFATRLAAKSTELRNRDTSVVCGSGGTMHVAEAQVKSERASRYLVQLCKHFSHKAPADYDEARGQVDFQPGLCVMSAADNRLTLRCEALSESDLHRVKDIVADHLVRFAWQEKIAVVWNDGIQSQSG